MNRALWAALVAASLVLVGCAGVTHVPIPDEKADQADRGVRYYRESLYLLVMSDGKGGVAHKLEFLPDPSKKMSICSHNFISKLETNYTFDKGVLTKSTETADSSKVPAAVVKAVGTALPSIVKFRGLMEEETPRMHRVPPPMIFKVIAEGDRIVFVGDHVRIHSDGKIEPIKVTIVPLSPENKSGRTS